MLPTSWILRVSPGPSRFDFYAAVLWKEKDLKEVKEKVVVNATIKALISDDELEFVVNKIETY